MFEAIKQWRQNRTTIVITHDLSQIVDTDFVYVLRDGRVVEEGFRADVTALGGIFSHMAAEQSMQPLPLKEDVDWYDGEEVIEGLMDEDHDETPFGTKQSGGGYFDVLAGYGNAPRLSKRSSFTSAISGGESPAPDTPRASWLVPSRPAASRQLSRESVRLSVQAPQTSRSTSYRSSRLEFSNRNSSNRPFTLFGDDCAGDLKARGEVALGRRAGLLYPGSRVDRVAEMAKNEAYDQEVQGQVDEATSNTSDQNLVMVIGRCIKSAPMKPALFLAFLLAIGHGIITPVWSKYISALMSLVAAGGRDRHKILVDSLIVIGLSVGDGICVGFSFVLFDLVAYRWVTNLRSQSFSTLISQDKTWFDRSENSPAALTNILIKDADDMIPIITNIPGDFMTAVTMISFGVLWAMVIGWKLTLLGISVIPVFVGAIGFQFIILNRIEIRNKRMREEVAKVFYEVRLRLKCPHCHASALTAHLHSPLDRLQHPRGASDGPRVRFRHQVRRGAQEHLRDWTPRSLDPRTRQRADERTDLLGRRFVAFLTSQF